MVFPRHAWQDVLAVDGSWDSTLNESYDSSQNEVTHDRVRYVFPFVGLDLLHATSFPSGSFPNRISQRSSSMRTTSIVSTILVISFAGAASASVSGMQGLYAKNYLLAADGSAATGGNEFYSVMDVYVKYNSAVGTGSAGERIVSFFGQGTTDAATYGVNKNAKYLNSANLAFQHSNTSWLPGASANGGAGNNTWDSFGTVGCRIQGAGNTTAITADTYFINPNGPNVSQIEGGSSGANYVGGGWYQAAPTDPAFETNASANADKLIMIGRFSLKCSDIIANGSPVKMTVWGDTTGKSTAQTGGTTVYTLASVNLKSDAQTKYTTGGKVWTFDSSFDGLDGTQAVWTFGVPAPGAAALIGLAALLTSRRRNM
jgi:hypothetical protein